MPTTRRKATSSAKARKSAKATALQRHRSRIKRNGLARIELKAPPAAKSILTAVALAFSRGDPRADKVSQMFGNPKPAEKMTGGEIFDLLQSFAPMGLDLTRDNIERPVVKFD